MPRVPNQEKRSQDKLYTHRELAVLLNNLVAASMRPASLGIEIPEKRKRKLRYIATEAIAELESMVGEELLRPEEVVFMLSASAFAFHLKNADWSDPLPYAKMCNELLGQKVNTNG